MLFLLRAELKSLASLHPGAAGIVALKLPDQRDCGFVLAVLSYHWQAHQDESLMHAGTVAVVAFSRAVTVISGDADRCATEG